METERLIKRKTTVRKLALKDVNPDLFGEFKSLLSSVKYNIQKDYNTYLLPKMVWFRILGGFGLILKIKTLILLILYSIITTDFDGNDECESDCVGDFVKIENVTYDDVVLAIKELKSSLTAAVDNIPYFIIKGCSEFLIYSLLVLLNLSLETKVFTEVWKQTRIIPVFKKGDEQNCKNYRPIAILSPFSKIFESIIHKKLYNQVENLISTSQHGFIPKRSTTTNLLCLTGKIISSFESGSQLGVIYTDFSKAFDSTDFGILLKKIQGIGFHINLIDWLLSYLCKRTLYVYFNNVVSHEFTSTSGVPQGSNIGPLLFILFINDLACVFKYSECLFFSDDLKLFDSVRSDLDSVLLQRDLDCLFKWCIDNRLHLNIEKCGVLSYTRKVQPLNHVYKINNLVLSRSNTVTDLGIIFDSKLDFSQHIDTMVSKTYHRLGFLKRRTREFSSELTLKVLYCAHIRPKLEYCSIIWNPNYRNKI
ncbi:putative RNA-directed DNA polymerase from transposon BS [Araneus ventricosus]|uniref:Putative RNA-directed DNA polymerase from transposon BS n=1 Tax=Araneus ventricosus TaxID=182803 RepID=A0A4Y2CZX9_ARAVE|nr:putative RNA-directed DNA polymerase from transposon BS [Araneus ventricosus]